MSDEDIQVNQFYDEPDNRISERVTEEQREKSESGIQLSKRDSGGEEEIKGSVKQDSPVVN